MNARRLASTALAACLLLHQGGASAATSPLRQEATQPAPAVDEWPVPPGTTLPKDGRRPAPDPGTLPRNGFRVGRFTAQGQQVEYSFEAAAGELSILDLATWGYARSWRSSAGIKILDARGRTIVATHAGGETAFRRFLPFVAPRKGTYRYQLSADEEYFRYTLVRHSDYRAERTVIPFDTRDTVRGFLADPLQTRSFALELRAGEEVAVTVFNDHPMAQRQKETRRSGGGVSNPGSMMGGGAPARTDRSKPAGRGGRAEGRGSPEPEVAGPIPQDFPDLLLQISHDGRVLADGSHFALFTAEHTGLHLVTVFATNEGEGGLFRVELTRQPERVAVTGYVGDEEDDPVTDMTLAFFREPGMDPIGEVRSDAEGEFNVSVLPGKYTVRMRPANAKAQEFVQTNLDRARELNLVWAPR